MLDILDDLFKDVPKNASPDKEADEIILIADRSGSMYSIREDAKVVSTLLLKTRKKKETQT